MNRISRSKAKAAGLTHYFTGGPCRNGHLSARFVANGKCAECHENRGEKRREHSRRWAQANPEKVREMERRHYAANREKTRERIQRRIAADPEKAKEQRQKVLQRYRDKKQCAQVSASIDRGLQNVKASGTILDLDTAVDLFKTHDNAFDFIGTVNG